MHGRCLVNPGLVVTHLARPEPQSNGPAQPVTQLCKWLFERPLLGHLIADSLNAGSVAPVLCSGVVCVRFEAQFWF